MRTITVELGERSYPIHIGEGLLQRAGEFLKAQGLKNGSPLLIVTDSHVAPLYLQVLETALQTEGYRTCSHIIEAGEASKSLKTYEEVMTTAIQAGLDRSSSVIALGGGVVGDLAGFVAATYMRGIKFVQMPTTILAHDSSVGGKVAVNHPLAKNMIGSFHQPTLVLYDLNTLQTLPAREVRAGLSEVLKEGLIWDAGFASWCDKQAEALLSLDAEALGVALERGCSIKAEVVSHDEQEHGLRAILNLGHTIGHALEAIGGYGKLLHGEAIAIGMVGAAKLAVNRGVEPMLLDETIRILQRFELPTSIPHTMDDEHILAAMMHDKKFKENQIVFILPEAIGKVKVAPDIQLQEVREVIRYLKEREEDHV
ncbi:3-dehydroquinate synthase [Paenibacillus sp. CAA11]|uniref:3-dehydroquinate synthase n=1 Tax=Paenibacillus sp. CAA11 TaxID=1532905 RepID=UPI000D342BCB|nr:3-dehydroquinate synthase [Paenibacillus sp. CAA11]AWB45009.1 3-dehydroquinate synthase [Paenibacillus sp. CAA11]